MISFVIPLLNEAETLEALFEGIARNTRDDQIEVIFVDDGSTDKSFEILKRLHDANPDIVKIIKLRRNYGKSHALNHGFRVASGEIIFTMDADLQDDPDEIPGFIDRLNEGYDLVSGWKQKRNDPWHKTLPSKLFNITISMMSGLKMHDFNCGFKAFRKEAAKSLSLYGEMHRFLPAFAHSAGFRVCEIVVKHHPRRHGVSKYGVRRLYRGFFDATTVFLVIKFRKRPLHFFGAIGVLVGLVGFGLLAYLSLFWFQGEAIGGRPLLIVSVTLMLAGLQLFSIGLMGELFIHGKQKGEEMDEDYSVISTAGIER